MSASSYDAVVIGAGPGGYVGAIRCAQLGLTTALVEEAELGGVCLNLGCIPSKAMLRSAEVLGLIRRAPEFGLEVEGVRADYSAVVARRDAAVAHLLKGVTNLLQSHGVEVLRGRARIRDSTCIQVASAGGSRTLSYRHLIVATGSRAAPLRVAGGDLPGVADSDGALALQKPPARAVVIGGGAVGVEWAEIWRAFGSEVVVLEMLAQLVPTEEREIGRELARIFANKGIEARTGARVLEVRRYGDGLEVIAEVDGQTVSHAADTVLASVGRRPNVEGVDLEAAGVRVEPTGIPTDRRMRTNVPHIFAVGDVTGGHLLAHVASHQGIVAAETIAGLEPAGFDERIAPSAIFTHPEIASVGLREHEAREQGIAVQVGRFPFAASGRAVASGETQGFVKVVAREGSGEVLGVHIIGPNAGDLIAEGVLAMRLGATIEDIQATIHVHPTYSEAILEAAWAAAGTPIHLPPRGRK